MTFQEQKQDYAYTFEIKWVKEEKRWIALPNITVRGNDAVQLHEEIINFTKHQIAFCNQQTALRNSGYVIPTKE